MKPIRLIAGMFTVGAWTMASRVLGFLREILITALIGPGPLFDAFVAAFRLPNMFRRFFAEGAFNAAFVPLFSKRLESGDNPTGFAQDALNLLTTAVLGLVALGMIFMPGLVWATANGFVGDARFDLAVGYGYVVFPYIFFMALAALFSGVLNATGRFAAAAAAPVLLNIFACAAMIAGALVGGEVIWWLIWAVPFAGVAQLALVWRAAEQADVRLRIGLPRLTPDMRHMVRVAVPAALAMGVVQINLLVGQFVASDIENALSWLFIADRLYQLPLGVVGIAVGIVLLPDLARKLSSGDEAGAKAAFSRSTEISLALSVPAAVAFVVIPLPLVSVLYERGATGPEDSAAIALALAIYGLGLPAFVLQKVLQPLYFAREDTRTPFRYALIAMVVNAVAAFGLKPFVGWIAPAIAASLAGWIMVALLWWGARGMGPSARLDARSAARLPKLVLASAAMAVVLFVLAQVMSVALVSAGWRYLAMLALILAAIISYFGAAHVLGALRLSELRGALRK